MNSIVKTRHWMEMHTLDIELIVPEYVAIHKLISHRPHAYTW